MRRKSRVGLLASAFALVASTCVMGMPAIAGASGQAPLNLDNEQGELWPCAFTPFNGFDAMFSVGTIYETLDFVNALQNAKVTPWLATAYAWSNSNKTLTFTIRSGVKWTDGTPFSAADVVYTFNLLKKYPALDLNAVWSVLSSVKQSGANKVVFNFSTSAVPYFFYVADQTPIVPEHIWSKIKNPVTDPIAKPVGTGGYELASCTPQNIKWTANPHYWQAGLPVVKMLNMPAFLSNNSANEYLAQGFSAYGAQFIPNIKSYFVAKKAGNGYWFPPVDNVSLFPNLKSGPTADVAVREAISYGINRAAISQKGEYGYEPPASQTGVVSPTFSSWNSSSAMAMAGKSYDPAKAKSVLEADGYKMGSDGFFSKNGKELSLTIVTNGGYSDWVAEHAGGRPGTRQGGYQDHGEPRRGVELHHRRLERTVPAGLRRGDRRTLAVLRDASVAVLEELGADRQAGAVELGAVLEPGDRRALEPVRCDDERGHPALDHRQDPDDHGPAVAGDPGPGRGRLVPVQLR